MWIRGSVTSITNWAGLNVTSSERRPDLSFSLPFHDRSSKLRTYNSIRHFAVEFQDYFLLCVDILEFIRWLFIRWLFIRRFLCVDTLKLIRWFFIRRFIIVFRDKLFCVWTRCNGGFAMDINYHGNTTQQPMKMKSMAQLPSTPSFMQSSPALHSNILSLLPSLKLLHTVILALKRLLPTEAQKIGL